MNFENPLFYACPLVRLDHTGKVTKPSNKRIEKQGMKSDPNTIAWLLDDPKFCAKHALKCEHYGFDNYPFVTMQENLEQLHPDFLSVNLAADMMNPVGNECAIVAVACATQVPYFIVHDAFVKAGKTPDKGATRQMTESVLQELGYDTELLLTSKQPSLFVETVDDNDPYKCTWDWGAGEDDEAVETAWDAYKYFKSIKRDEEVCNLTVKRLLKHLEPDKTYLVFIRKHVTAIRGGQIIDYVVNGRHHVSEVVKIWG